MKGPGCNQAHFCDHTVTLLTLVSEGLNGKDWGGGWAQLVPDLQPLQLALTLQGDADLIGSCLAAGPAPGHL